MKKINPGHVLVAGCCLALMLGVGFGIGITLRATQASRNSSGTYSLSSAPVTAGQVITPSLWNNTFNDLAADMTLSLDRNGRGGMLAALRGIDGTLAAPALSFTSETGSGLWRNGAGDVRMSILGALRENWTTTGVAITGTLGTTDTLTVSKTGAQASVFVDAATVTNQARYMLRGQGVDKWGLLKQTDDSLLLFDFVNSRAILSVATGAATPLVVGAPLQVGTSGTAIANAVWGTCTIGVGTTCPITVQSGAKCVCSWTTTTNPCAASVSGTTLTCTNGTVGITCNAICMN